MHPSPLHFLTKFKWLLAGGWTVILLVFLGWTLWQQYNETLNAALHTARTAFDKDLIYRRWASSHGGVYVPATRETPPNPYLSHLPNRDITTPKGQILTLMNPAYMTRQVLELGAEQYGHRGRITSLNPLRPENAPDPWEKKALQSFEREPVEVASLEVMDGKEYMRLMRPLATEESCLKCHAEQGYKVGDIRGGISISIPMEPLWDLTRSQSYLLLFGTGGIWLLGLAGVGFGARSLKRGLVEQEKTEKSLRKSREQLIQANEEVETIIDNSMVGIVFYNPEARAIRVNQRFADMLGLDPEQLLQGGPQLSRLLEDLHTMLYSHSMAGLQADETMRMERLLHSEDDKPVWCDVFCKAINTSHRGQGLIFVFNDITERKQAENALRENEEHLKTVLNSMHTGIMLVDRETQVIKDVNSFAADLLGAPKKDIIGSACHKYVYVDKGKCPILDMEQKADYSEHSLLASDGRHIPVIKTVVPIQRAGRSLLLENFTDITERKQLEKLREDVERIMRHDLKTPLNGIIGLPGLMLEDDSLNEEQREYLTLIREQGYRMLKLVNLSLDLFKMETGSYQYQPKPVDFTKLTGQLLRDVSGTAEGNGVGLAASVRGAPPDPAAPLTAPAEESLSYSMLSNLLANAVEASPEGQKVSLSIDEEDRGIVISIHNMGAVPEEMRDKFFQKYATLGKQGGTGLGAYSAKLMAETMGGTIAFTSSEAEGTTVTVRLPIG